jgi:hypothetical protein
MCRPSGVVLLVSARNIALASHAILYSVSVSAGQSPHEAAALFTQLGSCFQREPNRFQHCLLRLIRRPGTYLHSLILPSLFSSRAEMPRQRQNISTLTVPAMSRCTETA